MDDLDRLYDRLVANVRDGFPHLLERTFRLGDIPEHLVPYRTNRSALQYDSARQYELALMRLASGERGYLRVEPAVADAFRRALTAPEPDAALIRDHALATVALPDGAPTAATLAATASTATAAAPAPPPEPAPAEPAGEARVDAAPVGAAAPAEPPATEPPVHEPVRSPAPQMTDAYAAAPPGESGRGRGAATLTGRAGPTVIGGPCRYCGHTLPEGRPVTYCPYCGQNVTVRHCPACSTELEVDWQYCITCGRAMDDAALRADSR